MYSSLTAGTSGRPETQQFSWRTAMPATTTTAAGSRWATIRRVTDSCTSFGTPGTTGLPFAVAGISGGATTIAAYGARTAYVPYGGDASGKEALAATTDGGLSWTKHMIPGSTGGFNESIALGPNGEANVTWEANGNIWFARSANGGQTWTNPVQAFASPRQPASVGADLATDGSGKALLSLSLTSPGGDVTVFTREK